MINWNDYPNFEEREFRCSFTGSCDMQKEFLDILQRIRTRYGKPMTITSGYRDRTHPSEMNKSGRGEHTYGLCADVAVSRGDAFLLLKIALEEGIQRVGVNQKGDDRFLHLGLGNENLLTPTIWSY